MKWKVGDKVRLTGRDWPTYGTFSSGSEHTIVSVRGTDQVLFEKDSMTGHWVISEDWEIELVEREEETMSVDFSDVNVGDKVRLTRENGDETTFTVEGVWTGSIRSASNSLQGSSWDTLEIVERAFKPVPGLYSNHRTGDVAVIRYGGDSYYKASGGLWVNSSLKTGMSGKAARETHGWVREITF